ncbi:Phytochrome-like protein cph2 [Planctomycetes bacterium Pan216]|uniref:Phytochrome-like protein cph2 n=1 Tax=Kolteria novifilia TaxID=2527975 RepID=A0A518B9F4_9BACT|nr:Phytochrome-like protein cph2 [Planctomycetes bacterium Pan216]
MANPFPGAKGGSISTTDRGGSGGVTVQRESPKQSTDVETAEDLRANARFKSLVVEDNAATRLLIKRLLTQLHHDVTLCPDAASAIEAFGQDTFELAFIDCVLGDSTDGLDLCRRLRTMPKGKECVVTICTGAVQVDGLREVMKAGADDYLAKPFHADQFRVRVEVAENLALTRRRQRELESERLRLRMQLEARVRFQRRELHTKTAQLREEMSSRHQAEEQLRYDSFHDSLTGLPNRSLFLDRLGQVLKFSQRRQNYKYAVLVIGVDRFRGVNESIGHDGGDELLVQIARRLEHCLRPGDSVARLAGDEFTVLLDDVRDLSDATRVANRIQEQFDPPFLLGDVKVVISASIGIALSQPGYEEPMDVLRDADVAMSRAKALGKARYAIFDSGMQLQATRRLKLEADLHQAIERSEFVAYYQPIVSLEERRIRGFEALIRWQHPERGLLPPSEFIPIAEETGLIIPIGQWMIGEACRQLRRWEQATKEARDIEMSINVSSRQFSDPQLIDVIGEVLDQTGVNERHIRLEITESVMMDNAATITATLLQLRALDIQLGIDDFGTGYSSLSYLHHLPIDTLKIDRSFIRDLHQSRGPDHEIVRTIVSLASNLGMACVAEGVELPEQIHQIQELGCSLAQGFYFSRPVCGDIAERLLGAPLDW